MFIKKDGDIVEIGAGYNVGPGHGLIVYEINGEPRVNLSLIAICISFHWLI